MNPYKEKTSCDQSLKEYVNNNWKHDTINNIVLLESRESLNFFLGTVPESECMRGKSKNEIKSFFGIPQNITNNKFMYYMGSICNTPSARDCTYIHFDFDENGIYKEMGISGWRLHGLRFRVL
jgi:hypothetical protein